MLRLALVAVLMFALPVQASDGVIVWNDPEDLAIKMITFERDDPSRATSLRLLAELTTVSATMTAVTADGTGIGLCHQIRDDNEAPASISGYDRAGKRLWSLGASAFHAALQGALPRGLQITSTPDWFTFTCLDGGARGPGELVFDVGFGAGKPGPDGYVVSDTATDFRGRLVLSAKTGKVLAVAVSSTGRLALVLSRNPVQPVYTDANGQTLQLGNENGLVFPKGGTGRVTWGKTAIRWKGKPVVNGFDFAWYFPQD